MPESDFQLSHHDAGQVCADQPHQFASRQNSRTVAKAFRGNRSTNGGIEPKIAVRCVLWVPDTDDALGLTDGLRGDSVAGSLFEPVEAVFVGSRVRIMPACGHRSSCHYKRSALPTIADYAGRRAESPLG